MNTVTCLKCGCEVVNAENCEICGNVLYTMQEADKLTRKYTAFASFTAFCEGMTYNGNGKQTYCPTIHPNNRYRGPKVKGKVRLAEIIRAAGYRVFDGSTVS